VETDSGLAGPCLSTEIGTFRRCPRARANVHGAACAFSRTQNRHEPVREWLGLGKEVSKGVGSDILTAQWNWPVGKPLVDGLAGGFTRFAARISERSTACSSASAPRRWSCFTAS
jgi:hypothetical protein